MQCHLSRDVLQRLHFEVRGAYPRFDSAEGVLDGFASQRDLRGIVIETLLETCEDRFMLPSLDTTLLARCFTSV